jgi:hypothetical protein
MNQRCQFVFCLALATAIGASAQNTPPLASKNISPVPANLIPPIPQIQSPVNFFRQLLAMSPPERNAALTNRSPETRARIMAKVREYQALGPDECELRLGATELRWYLTPLLRAPATEREARLAQVPENLRGLVKSRLTQWEILPPPMQQEFLANDQALHYFARIETSNQPAATPEQQKIAGQFDQFFELTPAEKQRTLGSLSDSEHAQMEKTLQSFDKLPPQQRLTCLRNYARFAGMSGPERAEFLKNAESWSKMSPQDRHTWRDLVAHVPQWPPMPPPAIPPNLIPHATPKIPRPNMATNLN